MIVEYSNHVAKHANKKEKLWLACLKVILKKSNMNL